MARKKNISDEMRESFRKEVKIIVKHKLDEINHYIAGCDSPFSYMQVRDVQEHMVEIAEALGIGDEK